MVCDDRSRLLPATRHARQRRDTLPPRTGGVHEPRPV